MRSLKHIGLSALVGLSFGSAVGGIALWPAASAAAEPAQCQTVRMSDPGWTDITSTTTTASLILKAMGYKPTVQSLSVAISIEGLRSGNLDVFLGNWMPAQEQMTQKLIDAGSVNVLAVNLEGAALTLAVTGDAAKAGVKSFADLEKHGDKFTRTIFGIEPGSSANTKIKAMIDKNAYGLGSWKLVESSEAAMMASVDRATRRNEWAVFLGWAPHPMNVKLAMDYLDGGEDYFGANRGSATVRTLSRGSFAKDCTNLATLFKQMIFTVGMENELMVAILNDKMTPEAAVTSWLKAHPATLDPWLANVTTLAGKPALPVVKGALGIGS